MWLKTFIALLVGLFINASLVLNLTFILPLPIDVLLLLGYILSFILWAGVMTWFYCHETLRQALKPCVPIFLVSVAVNVFMIMGGNP